MRIFILFIIVMAISVSCITILPQRQGEDAISLEQHKCVSIYKSAIIKKCNYDKNPRQCYDTNLRKSRLHIYEECGIIIN